MPILTESHTWLLSLRIPIGMRRPAGVPQVGTYQNYTVVAEGLNAGEQVVVARASQTRRIDPKL